MWSDPIVSEVRAARDAHAGFHHYDLESIFRDLKKQEQLSGRKFVRLDSRSVPQKADRPAKS
jgi:hypothetical protein